jgi:hypothetical protein
MATLTTNTSSWTTLNPRVAAASVPVRSRPPSCHLVASITLIAARYPARGSETQIPCPPANRPFGAACWGSGPGCDERFDPERFGDHP